MVSVYSTYLGFITLPPATPHLILEKWHESRPRIGCCFHFSTFMTRNVSLHRMIDTNLRMWKHKIWFWLKISRKQKMALPSPWKPLATNQPLSPYSPITPPWTRHGGLSTTPAGCRRGLRRTSCLYWLGEEGERHKKKIPLPVHNPPTPFIRRPAIPVKVVRYEKLA